MSRLPRHGGQPDFAAACENSYMSILARLAQSTCVHRFTPGESSPAESQRREMRTASSSVLVCGKEVCALITLLSGSLSGRLRRFITQSSFRQTEHFVVGARDGPKTDIEAVERIDHSDGKRQLRELLLAELRANTIVDFVRNPMLGELGDCFRPLKGRPFLF
jgi:hypothetical protein